MLESYLSDRENVLTDLPISRPTPSEAHKPLLKQYTLSVLKGYHKDENLDDVPEWELLEEFDFGPAALKLAKLAYHTHHAAHPEISYLLWDERNNVEVPVSNNSKAALRTMQGQRKAKQAKSNIFGTLQRPTNALERGEGPNYWEQHDEAERILESANLVDTNNLPCGPLNLPRPGSRQMPELPGRQGTEKYKQREARKFGPYQIEWNPLDWAPRDKGTPYQGPRTAKNPTGEYIEPDSPRQQIIKKRNQLRRGLEKLRSTVCEVSKQRYHELAADELQFHIDELDVMQFLWFGVTWEDSDLIDSDFLEAVRRKHN